jgi:hypothetical protein
VRLANVVQLTNEGPTLTSKGSRCFIIPLTIHIDFNSVKVHTLLDSGTFACFIDKSFAKRHRFPLVLKKYPVLVEVIDGRPLASEDIIGETIPLEIVLNIYRSKVVFNVIKSPSNPIVLGLSWLEEYNPDINWKTRKLAFQSSNIATQDPSSIEPGPTLGHWQTNKCARTLKNQIPAFIGARAFMRAAKQGTMFIVYTTPMAETITGSSTLLEQYKEYQDVFEKKNVDMLPQHRPYDCMIEL